MTILGSAVSPSPEAWQGLRWDLAFVGAAVDDRGRSAFEFVRAVAGQIVVVQDYAPETLDLLFAGVRTSIDDVSDNVATYEFKTVLLEATTLGFVETFVLIRALRNAGVATVDILYLEPDEYVGPATVRISSLAHRREFELSADVSGFRAIPGAAILLLPRSKHRVVFFVGFEGRRLDVAFEDFPMLRPEASDLVFGVPAYAPGWEMNALSNNIGPIIERRFGGDIYYCSASEPSEAQRVIAAVASTLREGEALLLAPIGTKPHGIAVAEYVASNPGVGILYDHPSRKSGRSAGVRLWHRYRAALHP